MIIKLIKYILMLILFLYVLFCFYPILNPSVSSGKLNDADEFVIELVNGLYSKPFVLIGDISDVNGAFNDGSNFSFEESFTPMYNFRIYPETKEYLIMAQPQGWEYKEPILVVSTISFLGTEYIFQASVLR
ncbi:hypothetical protein ACFL6Z_02225 [Pseudomonadota bacterium]|uniref:hypothetical protein n=1 Tax=Shewanella sp. 3_MG-2023 TaxID=3062635 RepID=UPI0026E2648A|nr:hypothetical protein [Shewanella sp. 3_MG-2023]MDO6774126.1 hypothetical protein [Shewanella sp. 3_MG-2023]